MALKVPKVPECPIGLANLLQNLSCDCEVGKGNGCVGLKGQRLFDEPSVAKLKRHTIGDRGEKEGTTRALDPRDSMQYEPNWRN
jgi:hypothetical protein